LTISFWTGEVLNVVRKINLLTSNFRCSLTNNGPLAEYTNVSRATSLGRMSLRMRKIKTYYRLETTT